ncbi:DUF5063 domain-containing protein [Planococcus liqunii]|uniref:DUF5063 domain-containing protein n=1 Tax=Planococcus liqunii TaxID=3058394 RepID=UPI0026301A66|nr:DUF5063 domain-containing protein [Planococcus sp. N056]WKA52337.1 DUF5063 domain-containing protein [Planococcus sp. N056]
MESTEVEVFLQAAKRYCHLMDSLNSLGEIEKFKQLHAAVTELYAKALYLPETEPGKDDSFDIDFQLPQVDFGTHNVYWGGYDPYHSDEDLEEIMEEPLNETLTDDVLDIYSDVKRGLILYEQGNHAEAIAEWKYNFEIHWGTHAASAIRALHSVNYL